MQNSDVSLTKEKNSKITNYLGNLSLNNKNYIFGLTSDNHIFKYFWYF